MDFKENQRNIAEKDTSFGVLHTFQKRPNCQFSIINFVLIDKRRQVCYSARIARKRKSSTARNCQESPRLVEGGEGRRMNTPWSSRPNRLAQ